MGGDRGAAEIVAGAVDARSASLEPVLFGDASLDAQGLELQATSETIAMHEKPSEAVRAKPDSSLVAAVRAVADGRADAVVSAGNTGAMLAAGLLVLRRIPGVLRPAIAVPIPAQRGPSVLLDAGANADARPEHLLQFATMGAVFAEEILERANPEVRLLSIGEEPEKGNQLVLEAHELLAASDLNFTGNVVLKTLEGTIRTILEALRAEITATTTGKVGGLLIRPAARRLRHRLDPDTYGGAYLLGLRGLAVIAHGNSSRTAIANAIRLAARGVDHDVPGRLASRMAALSERGRTEVV
jgi:glycerol-3-phosphate acyltransferase PlsX